MIKAVEEADYSWMTEELEGDLKKLFKEAENKKDSVSKKIVDNIDEWLRSELKHTIVEY